MKKNDCDSGNADGADDGGKKDTDVSITLDEWNKFEAEDSSADSTYVPKDDEASSDSYVDIDDDDIEGFDPKNIYKNYPKKTSATSFCTSNVRDEFEMTASQESELPIEPTDKFETTSSWKDLTPYLTKMEMKRISFNVVPDSIRRKKQKLKKKLKMSSWVKKRLSMESHGKTNSISRKKIVKTIKSTLRVC